MSETNRKFKLRNLDTEKLITLWNEGILTADIAKQLDISPSSMAYSITYLRRKGVVLNKRKPGKKKSAVPEFSPSDEDIIKAWNGTSKSTNQIANDQGVSSTSIRKRITQLRGMGHALKSRKRWSGETSKLTSDISDKLGTVPDTVVAKEAGVTRERVRQWRALKGVSSHDKRNENAVPAEELVEAWNAVSPFSEDPIGVLAAKFNIKKGSVTNRISRLRKAGYEVFSLSETRRILFTETWNNGESPKEIAIQLGITSIRANGLAQYYRKNGFEIKRFRMRRKESSAEQRIVGAD